MFGSVVAEGGKVFCLQIWRLYGHILIHSHDWSVPLDFSICGQTYARMEKLKSLFQEQLHLYNSCLNFGNWDWKGGRPPTLQVVQFVFPLLFFDYSTPWSSLLPWLSIVLTSFFINVQFWLYQHCWHLVANCESKSLGNFLFSLQMFTLLLLKRNLTYKERKKKKVIKVSIMSESYVIKVKTISHRCVLAPECAMIFCFCINLWVLEALNLNIHSSTFNRDSLKWISRDDSPHCYCYLLLSLCVFDAICLIIWSHNVHWIQLFSIHVTQAFDEAISFVCSERFDCRWFPPSHCFLLCIYRLFALQGLICYFERLYSGGIVHLFFFLNWVT